MPKEGDTAGKFPGAIRAVLLCAVLASVLLSPGALADQADTARALAERWEGRWVVVTGEVRSGCDGTYTNNQVRGGQVHKEKGGWERRLRKLGRFVGAHAAQGEYADQIAEARTLAAGELGSVHSVKVRDERIDLLIDLPGRWLLPYEHGPFTLFEEAWCKIQLQFEVPERAVKRGELDQLEDFLGGAVERFESEAAARSSDRWNGREDNAYPGDYDETLHRYAEWRNREIERGLEEALAVAAEMGARLSTSSAYYDGFYRGVEALGPIVARRSCERLVGHSLESMMRKPGMGEIATNRGIALRVAVEDEDGPESYAVFDRRGYEDGQRLVHALTMVERLPACRLPEGGEP